MGWGFETTNIRSESTIVDKNLALSGEENPSLGPRKFTRLAPSLSESEAFLSPTDKEVKDALTQRVADFGTLLIAPPLGERQP